jgi:glutamate racemase
VVVYPCTGLAEYIEENIFNLPEKLPQGYLPDVSVSSVVLGCTHYIFIEEIIKKYYSCEVFDGIVGTADHLANILGIGDHSFKNYQKITFKNGNCTKNRDIFRHLVVKGDKSR